MYALFELERHIKKDDTLILIEPRDYFVFTPLLHEVAGGVLHKESVTAKYTDLLHHIKHSKATAEHIDFEKKTVIANNKKYAFDYLLIASGSKTNFFGKKLPALELKTYEDAIAIRTTIEQNVITAANLLAKNDTAAVTSLLSAIIIGGGATGVELAGEAIDLFRFRMQQQGIPHKKAQVFLVQAQKRLLPQLPEYFHSVAAKKLKAKGVQIIFDAKVHAIAENNVAIKTKNDAITMNASCIVWTAGIQPNTIPPSQNHFVTKKTLQVERHSFAFALGDVAKMDPLLPALAQVASKQGVHAAKNVMRMIRGQEPLPFSYKDHGMLISIGQKYAVGNVFGIPIKGFLAWVIMRTVYLFKFRNLRQEFRTSWEYTVRLFIREKSCMRRNKRF